MLTCNNTDCGIMKIWCNYHQNPRWEHIMISWWSADDDGYWLYHFTDELLAWRSNSIIMIQPYGRYMNCDHCDDNTRIHATCLSKMNKLQWNVKHVYSTGFTPCQNTTICFQSSAAEYSDSQKVKYLRCSCSTIESDSDDGTSFVVVSL